MVRGVSHLLPFEATQHNKERQTHAHAIVYVCVYVYVHAHVHVSIVLHVCVCVCVCICTRVPVYVCKCMCASVRVNRQACLHMCARRYASLKRSQVLNQQGLDQYGFAKNQAPLNFSALRHNRLFLTGLRKRYMFRETTI